MARWLLEFDDPEAVLEEIVRLRRRGLGARRIAKLVFGNRVSLEAGTKRIQRLLAKLVGKGETLRSVDLDNFLDTYPKHSVLKAKPLLVGRLGPTQRLILDYLNTVTAATPSEIRYYICSQGVCRSRRAVQLALHRMLRRGLVFRVGRGLYSLSTGLYHHDLLVENLYVAELPIPLHSKKLRGYAAPLSSVIRVAEQLNATTVERMELWRPAPGKQLREEALRLRRLGWRLTKIYYNTAEGTLKVEHIFYEPPYPLKTAYMPEFLKLYSRATMLARNAAASILQAVGISVQGVGRRAVSKSGCSCSAGVVGCG